MVDPDDAPIEEVLEASRPLAQPRPTIRSLTQHLPQGGSRFDAASGLYAGGVAGPCVSAYRRR
jgi:hypothetical protein